MSFEYWSDFAVIHDDGRIELRPNLTTPQLLALKAAAERPLNPGSFHLNPGSILSPEEMSIIFPSAPDSAQAEEPKTPSIPWQERFNYGRAAPLPELDSVKCECGTEKVGGSTHSNWCPKAVK